MNFDDILSIIARGEATGDDLLVGGRTMPIGDYVVWRVDDIDDGGDAIMVRVMLVPRIDDDSAPQSIVGIMSIEEAYGFALDLLAATATDDDTAALWEHLRGQTP